ncbi:hypothetical protein ZWY2020_020359 [Hordeum vulgare]|nr:hypothetical protein ZWY2020_020359 [Hordeum vulgare]
MQSACSRWKAGAIRPIEGFSRRTPEELHLFLLVFAGGGRMSYSDKPPTASTPDQSLIRIFGRNLLGKNASMTDMIFSMPKKSLRHYRQEDYDVIKNDI